MKIKVGDRFIHEDSLYFVSSIEKDFVIFDVCKKVLWGLRHVALSEVKIKKNLITKDYIPISKEKVLVIKFDNIADEMQYLSEEIGQLALDLRPYLKEDEEE